MLIKPASKPQAAPPASDYWDLPEIAMLLRVVTHINVGATIALCVWLATQAFNTGGVQVLFHLTSEPSQAACRCELQLTPIVPGNRQWVCSQPECGGEPRS